MRRKFTQEDDDFIRENYLTMPMCEISRKLGRSKTCARQRAPKLGCIVPRETSDIFRKNSQLKPGIVAYNKGKKQHEFMSAEAIEKSMATRFKPGIIPHNTLYDGAIIKRKYGNDVYHHIRISKSNWVPLHRHIWEQANGKIANDMNVAFKNGDIYDCRLDNLELVTDAEMMKRNSIHTNYPADLCQLIQLNGAMKRKISNKIKKSENSK